MLFIMRNGMKVIYCSLEFEVKLHDIYSLAMGG